MRRIRIIIGLVCCLLYAVLFTVLFELGWRTSYVWSFWEESASVWKVVCADAAMICICLVAALILAGLTYLLAVRVHAGWTVRIGKRSLFINALVLMVCVDAFAVCALVVSAYGRTRRYHADRAQVGHIRELLAGEKKILHACGEITGPDGTAYTYTNSIEALRENIDKGFHFIEIDFRLTTDKELVCIHSWKKDFVKADGSAVEDAVSLEEFRQGTIEGLFTPMTVEDLQEILQDYPDVYVVMDIKVSDMLGSYRAFAKRYPELMPHLIPQFYHASQYDYLYGLGYHAMIFSLYRSGMWEYSAAALDSVIRRECLVGVTFRKRYVNGAGGDDAEDEEEDADAEGAGAENVDVKAAESADAEDVASANTGGDSTDDDAEEDDAAADEAEARKAARKEESIRKLADLLPRVLASRQQAYVHTVDDPAEQQEMYALGVTAVYTNR